MPAFLIPLLGSLLPTLIGFAEKKFGPGNGNAKKTWVLGLLGDIWDIGAKHFDVMKVLEPVKPMLLDFISGVIDAEVSKLKS
jgi:hypothetical protein